MPPKKNQPKNSSEALSKAEKVEAALKAWHEANGALSFREVGKRYDCAWTTVRDRARGAKSKSEASSDLQKLSPKEEEQLAKQIEILSSWGWPPQVSTLRQMATELWNAKGGVGEVGPNWPQHFIDRNPTMRTRFIPPLDKDRAKVSNEEQIRRYFELFRKTKTEYNIHDDDVYNMDEKGVMMGVLAKLKVVCPRRWSKVYVTQAGSREWVSMIECICSDGRVLTPWVIFKAKKQKKEWFSNFAEGHIAISEKGWTDNELCVEWLKQCFDPETEVTRKGEYRMLLFDGHGSHLSKDVFQFCHDKNIILLCLPSHSTHLLQPLDIGVFGPFAHFYRDELLKETSFGAHYSIDKLLFLKLYQRARELGITHSNVKSAWAKSGLFPFNPEGFISELDFVKLAREQAAKTAEAQVIVQKPYTIASSNTAIPEAITLEVAGRPETPPDLPISALPKKTPTNVADVAALVKLSKEIEAKAKNKASEVQELSSVVEGLTSVMNGLKAEVRELRVITEKVGNSATIAFTDAILTKRANADLLAAQERAHQRTKRDGTKFSDARVMSLKQMEREEAAKAEAQAMAARKKRLDAQQKKFQADMNQIILQMHKWGDYVLLEAQAKLRQQAQEKQRRLIKLEKKWRYLEQQTWAQFCKWGEDMLYNPKPFEAIPDPIPITPSAPRKASTKTPQTQSFFGSHIGFRTPKSSKPFQPSTPSKRKSQVTESDEEWVEHSNTIETPITLSRTGRTVRRPIKWEPPTPSKKSKGKRT